MIGAIKQAFDLPSECKHVLDISDTDCSIYLSKTYDNVLETPTLAAFIEVANALGPSVEPTA